MKEIIQALEEIEKNVKGGDRAKIEKAIQSAKSKLSPPTHRLHEELSVWQTKLDIILKEKAGREGMAKHARHWVEELRRNSGG